MLTSDNLTVKTLGPCNYDSPLNLSESTGDGLPDYTPEGTRVLYHMDITPGMKVDSGLTYKTFGCGKL